VSEKDDKDKGMTKEERQQLKDEYAGIFMIADNDPSGDLMKVAEEYRRRLNKKNANAFKNADDAADFWQNALRDNEYWSGQSVAEQTAETNEADSSLAGEVEDQKNDVSTSVENAARNIGISLDPTRMAELTDQAWREGWNESQIREALRADTDSLLGQSEDNAGFGGTLGATAADLSEWSARNGFAIAQEDADRMLASVAFGEKTYDQIQQELRQSYMVGAFPAWADMINAGMDIYDLASPYRSVAQRMLGRGNITMTDPIMKEMMMTQNADGSFSQRALWDAEKYIRNTDEWQYTDDAADTYAKGMKAVSSMFGFG
jgi:hypothetical protein